MNEQDSVWFIYTTAPNRDVANQIARALITERVAACVNILGDMTSIYTWNGALEESAEIAMIVKTTRAQYAAVEAIIRLHHTYECPCIVGWPIERGYAPFMDWVRKTG